MLNLVDNAGGSIASVLLRNGMDPRRLRPWIGNDGRTYVEKVVKNNDGSFVCNAEGKPKTIAVPVNNATVSGYLRKDDWLAIDRSVLQIARERLRVVGAIRGMGLQHTVADGFGRMGLERERVSDLSEATFSMDGRRQSANDQPLFDIGILPLPICSKDFTLPARQLAASKNGGSPLDTTSAETATRKVVEAIEQLTLGTTAFGSFAALGGTVYGLTNFSGRLLKNMTAPTATGWTPTTTVNEVLAMRSQAQASKHFGDYYLFASLSWDTYLDGDYKSTYNDMTLRQRLGAIKGIKEVMTVDFLPAKTMLLVQMTKDVVRMVVALEIMVLQWPTMGGMEENFKVMGVIVPDLRTDQKGNSGIVHGTHA